MTITWDRIDSISAKRQGWDIFTMPDGYRLAKNQPDEYLYASEIYEKYECDAWLMVTDKANQKSELHVKALAFLFEHAPDHAMHIFRHACARREALSHQTPGNGWLT